MDNLDLETFRQKAEYSAAFEHAGKITLTWHELVALISAIEDQQGEIAELEEANRELQDSSHDVAFDHENEIEALENENAELKKVIEGMSKCQECGRNTPLCDDCWATGGR